MGWLEDAAGAATGGIIGAVGSYFSGKSAQDYATRAYKHRYQWQVKDMQKAGINPMLAFSQGPPAAPSPHVPDIGEAFSSGTRSGAAVSQASTAKRLVAAQEGSLSAQAEASNAMARKTNAEAAILESGGSAKQSAEIGSLQAGTHLANVHADKAVQEINALKTQNAQLEYMLKLEQDVKRATAANLNAGIPPKLLLAEVANIAREVVEGLRKPETKSAAKSIFRDTINMLEDKAKHAKSSAKGAWQSIKDLPNTMRKPEGSW